MLHGSQIDLNQNLNINGTNKVIFQTVNFNLAVAAVLGVLAVTKHFYLSQSPLLVRGLIVLP